MLLVRKLLPLPFLLMVACNQPIPVVNRLATSDKSNSNQFATIQTPVGPIITNSITTPSTAELPSIEQILTVTAESTRTRIPGITPSPAAQALLQEEKILILAPGPGSRVTNPVHITGRTSLAHEQILAARLVAENGSILASAPIQFDAIPGDQKLFKVDLRVESDKLTQALIQVYASNIDDGGFTHLSSAAITFAPSGAPNILPVPTQLERIIIGQPVPGAPISGGVAHIEGFGLASFEQTLLVEVIGPDGMTAGKQPLIVNAPDIGKPGAFQADVAYQISVAGLGRILVYDPTPTGAGVAHSSSIDVNLSP